MQQVNVIAKQCLVSAVQGQHQSGKREVIRETDKLQTSLHNVSIISLTSEKQISSMGKVLYSFWLSQELQMIPGGSNREAL